MRVMIGTAIKNQGQNSLYQGLFIEIFSRIYFTSNVANNIFIIATSVNNNKYSVGDAGLMRTKCVRNDTFCIAVYIAVFSHKKSPVVTRLFKIFNDLNH